LFSIFSPFAVLGPYSALTADFSNVARNKIAIRIGLYTMLNLILIAWFGNYILQILGLSLGALRCAGGLVLILAALPMIRKGDSPRRKVNPDSIQQDEGWRAIVVTPLLFPITMGAGTISLVITQASQGNDVITRIGGIILLSLAIMIFTSGLRELLPGLG